MTPLVQPARDSRLHAQFSVTHKQSKSQERESDKWLELKYTCLWEARQLVSQLPAKNYIGTFHTNHFWEVVREKKQENFWGTYRSVYSFERKRKTGRHSCLCEGRKWPVAAHKKPQSPMAESSYSSLNSSGSCLQCTHGCTENWLYYFGTEESLKTWWF